SAISSNLLTVRRVCSHARHVTAMLKVHLNLSQSASLPLGLLGRLDQRVHPLDGPMNGGACANPASRRHAPENSASRRTSVRAAAPPAARRLARFGAPAAPR